MNRAMLAVAAALTVIALSGCNDDSSNEPAAAPAASTPAPTKAVVSSTPPAQTPTTAAPSKSAAPAASAPAGGSSCSPTRDVIVRYIAPGLPASSQVLGDYDLQNCTTTFQSLATTSPTKDGFCTEAAWASDNPGYDADATPSAPLKNVQIKVGPAC